MLKKQDSPEADNSSPAGPSSGQSVFESWVDEHGDYLYRYALLHLRQEHLAEDLVQDALVSALRNQDSFQGKSTVRTWIVAILKHKIIDHFRKVNRRKTVSMDMSDDENKSQAYAEAQAAFQMYKKSWKGDPDQVLAQKDFSKALYGCLQELPERLREAFMLREISELDTDEICETLAITPNNLWVMLHRARSGLRKCIEKHWFTN